MFAINQIPDDWDIVKVTIGATGTATPTRQLCCDCMMYQSTGSGATVKAAGKTETLALPASLAEAFSLKIRDLSKLTFNGTENDVITIVWLGFTELAG